MIWRPGLCQKINKQTSLICFVEGRLATRLREAKGLAKSTFEAFGFSQTGGQISEIYISVHIFI